MVQYIKRKLPDILTADTDHSLGNIIIMRNQPGYRALTASGFADQSRHLSFFCFKGQSFQDFITLICETDIFKTHLPVLKQA